MYNQANQITKAVCDMTPKEKDELLKVLTLEQKHASAMEASSVVGALEPNDTTHANVVSLESSSLQSNSKKQKRNELSETRTNIRTKKSTKTSDR